MEEASSRGHEASPQSGLSVGCKLCSSSKKQLRGLSARAQARRICIPSLKFFVVGVSSFLSPLYSVIRSGAWEWECNEGSR